MFVEKFPLIFFMKELIFFDCHHLRYLYVNLIRQVTCLYGILGILQRQGSCSAELGVGRKTSFYK